MVVSGGRSETSKRCAAWQSHIPAHCSEVRVQLQSLDFTETHRRAQHDLASLYQAWSAHAYCNAAVVDCKASYDLSDRRGWWDGAVYCCLPSIGYDYWRKYWANTNTTQYRQVLANTQYSNTGIVRTLAVVVWTYVRSGLIRFSWENRGFSSFLVVFTVETH